MKFRHAEEENRDFAVNSDRVCTREELYQVLDVLSGLELSSSASAQPEVLSVDASDMWVNTAIEQEEAVLPGTQPFATLLLTKRERLN